MNGKPRFRDLGGTVYSTVPVLHTRLRRRCGIVVRRRFLCPDRPFARLSPGRDARVFRPCSRGTGVFVRHGSAERIQRLRTPCAHRLGEQTKDPCHGRVLSLRERAEAVPGCRASLTKPGSRFPAILFNGRRLWTPHAFHEIDVFPSWRRLFIGHHQTRDSHRAHARCSSGAPFCEANDHRSRPDRSPSPSLDAEPRSASRLRLDIAVKMPRLRFYNQRFASRAPAKTPSPETTAVRPGITRRRSASGSLLARGVSAVRSSATPDHLAVTRAIIQPPTVTCLTARKPASG